MGAEVRAKLRSGLWVTVSFSLCSVLESDPQFGFEEAKKKLQGRGTQGSPLVRGLGGE